MSATRARWLLAGSILLASAGLAVGAAVITLQHSEAQARSGREPARAVVANVDGRQVVVFDTADGQRIVAPAPPRPGEPLGQTAAVRYDPANPSDVILAESTFGRDITLWIVACKLLVGGIIFAVVAARRLRRSAVPLQGAGPAQSVGMPKSSAQFS
jgi:hypothetical protein